MDISVLFFRFFLFLGVHLYFVLLTNETLNETYIFFVKIATMTDQIYVIRRVSIFNSVLCLIDLNAVLYRSF